MARGRGGARLSIYTTFDDAGVKRAERAMRDFTKQYGTLTDGPKPFKALSADVDALARRSIALDQAAGRLRGVSDGLQSAGRAFMPFTAVIGGIAIASTKAAVEFESSFAGVRKTVDATEEEFRALEEAAREMAEVKPVDVNDINRIMELGGQLGIATDNLAGFASVVADLDVATDMNVEDAAMQMARFMNIMGTSQKDVQRVGSTIVDLGNNAATTESQIMDMAMRIAGSGKQVGLTEAEVLAMAAALSSVGIEAESGGSAVSKTMTEIDKAVASNSKDLSQWAKLTEKSVDQFTRLWQDDAAAALELVFEGLGTVKDEGGNLNLMLEELGITELRQSDMMKRMAGASDILSDSVKTGSKAWEENSALTEEASKRYSTTESKLKMLGNKVQDVGISLGGPMVDALSDVVDAIEPLLKRISDAAQSFSEMDEASQRTIITLVGLAAAIGPVLVGSGKLVGAVADVASGLGKLTAKAAAARAAQDLANTAMGGGAAAGGRFAGGLGKVASSIAGVSSGTVLLYGALAVAAGGFIYAAVEAAKWTGKNRPLIESINSVRRASEDLDNAVRKLEAAEIDERQAKLDVEVATRQMAKAQEAHAKAVKEYGAESEQAVEASLALEQATISKERAEKRYQDTIQQTKAELAATAAESQRTAAETREMSDQYGMATQAFKDYKVELTKGKGGSWIRNHAGEIQNLTDEWLSAYYAQQKYQGATGGRRAKSFGGSNQMLMAEGGFVNRATRAIIGEAGPEVVIPLSTSRRDRAYELLAAAAKHMGITGAGGGSAYVDNRTYINGLRVDSASPEGKAVIRLADLIQAKQMMGA